MNELSKRNGLALGYEGIRKGKDNLFAILNIDILD